MIKSSRTSFFKTWIEEDSVEKFFSLLKSHPVGFWFLISEIVFIM